MDPVVVGILVFVLVVVLVLGRADDW